MKAGMWESKDQSSSSYSGFPVLFTRDLIVRLSVVSSINSDEIIPTSEFVNCAL